MLTAAPATNRTASRQAATVISMGLRSFALLIKRKTTYMPSFDIVSKVDQQVLDNAVNVTKKEITNRFDFKDSPGQIDLNKKDMKIDLEADSEMKIKQIVDVLLSRSMKQGLDPLAFDLSKDAYPSGKV